ncbi:hypothetical protein [Edaphobacter dinghuensis]|nr:hypothetical protein [Edaphobacter dinghuensis]
MRFNISAGTAARRAEQEEQERESAGPRPRIHLRGGTAARMAENEAPIAAQRPYSMSMQARTGKPFTLADVAAEKKSSSSQEQQSVPEDRRRGNAILTSSFRPASRPDKFSTPTGNHSVFEEGVLPRKFDKEAQIPPRSPLQTLRDLFSRTLPEQDKKQS